MKLIIFWPRKSKLENKPEVTTALVTFLQVKFIFAMSNLYSSRKFRVQKISQPFLKN